MTHELKPCPACEKSNCSVDYLPDAIGGDFAVQCCDCGFTSPFAHNDVQAIRLHNSLPRRSDSEELERLYRTELLFSHGHAGVDLYTDDGELQCSACGFDFKRADLEACRQQRIKVKSAMMQDDLTKSISKLREITRKILQFFPDPPTTCSCGTCRKRKSHE